MSKSLPPIHLVGNVAVDVIVQNSASKVRQKGGKSTSNIQIVDSASESVLAGNADWPAYLLGKMGHPVELNTKIGATSMESF